jgi:hypothetical protein
MNSFKEKPIIETGDYNGVKKSAKERDRNPLTQFLMGEEVRVSTESSEKFSLEKFADRVVEDLLLIVNEETPKEDIPTIVLRLLDSEMVLDWYNLERAGFPNFSKEENVLHHKDWGEDVLEIDEIDMKLIQESIEGINRKTIDLIFKDKRVSHLTGSLYFTKESLNKQSGWWRIHRGLFAKKIYRASGGPQNLSIRHKEQQVGALKRLYDLGERSPYILYSLLTVDSNTSAEIHKQVSFTDLNSLMNPKEGLPQISPAETLEVVRDFLKGCLFLVSNGLFLSDLNPMNVGVVEKEKKKNGVVFDLDGLYVLGQEAVMYISKDGYIPPEITSNQMHGWINPEKRVLKQILGRVEDALEPQKVADIVKEISDRTKLMSSNASSYTATENIMMFEIGVMISNLVSWQKSNFSGEEYDGMAKKLSDVCLEIVMAKANQRGGVRKVLGRIESILGDLN